MEKKDSVCIALLVDGIVVRIGPPARDDVDDDDHGHHHDDARQDDHRDDPVGPAAVELAVAVAGLVDGRVLRDRSGGARDEGVVVLAAEEVGVRHAALEVGAGVRRGLHHERP